MDFTQWKTHAVDMNYKPIGPITRIGWFTFDADDVYSFDKATMDEMKEYTIEQEKEDPMLGNMKPSIVSYYFIREDDEKVFKYKCLDLLSRLFGLGSFWKVEHEKIMELGR